MAISRPKPLWTCPQCGHRFVTRNLWHSCVRVLLRTHFHGTAAAHSPTYRAWAALARACAPVTIYPQKTRIVFQVRVRFGGAVVRAGYLDASLWLRGQVRHPRLRRIESIGALGYGLHFRLVEPREIDDDLGRLMRKAYELARDGSPARRHTNAWLSPAAAWHPSPSVAA